MADNQQQPAANTSPTSSNTGSGQRKKSIHSFGRRRSSVQRDPYDRDSMDNLKRRLRLRIAQREEMNHLRNELNSSDSRKSLKDNLQQRILLRMYQKEGNMDLQDLGESSSAKSMFNDQLMMEYQQMMANGVYQNQIPQNDLLMQQQLQQMYFQQSQPFYSRGPSPTQFNNPLDYGGIPNLSPNSSFAFNYPNQLSLEVGSRRNSPPQLSGSDNSQALSANYSSPNPNSASSLFPLTLQRGLPSIAEVPSAIIPTGNITISPSRYISRDEISPTNIFKDFSSPTQLFKGFDSPNKSGGSPDKPGLDSFFAGSLSNPSQGLGRERERQL